MKTRKGTSVFSIFILAFEREIDFEKLESKSSKVCKSEEIVSSFVIHHFSFLAINAIVWFIRASFLEVLKFETLADE